MPTWGHHRNVMALFPICPLTPRLRCLEWAVCTLRAMCHTRHDVHLALKTVVRSVSGMMDSSLITKDIFRIFHKGRVWVGIVGDKPQRTQNQSIFYIPGWWCFGWRMRWAIASRCSTSVVSKNKACNNLRNMAPKLPQMLWSINHQLFPFLLITMDETNG